MFLRERTFFSTLISIIFSIANTPASFKKVPASPSKAIARKIPTNAEKVLDAPSYIDDYCECQNVFLKL